MAFISFPQFEEHTNSMTMFGTHMEIKVAHVIFEFIHRPDPMICGHYVALINYLHIIWDISKSRSRIMLLSLLIVED